MELGDAMNAMATVNDDGSVSLSWTAGANATRHYVAGARKNDDGSYDTVRQRFRGGGLRQLPHGGC